MHFGQTLAANQIPEWKSQYVDFRHGKKLIASLDKKLTESQQGNWDLPPPALPQAPQNGNVPQHSRREVNDQSPLLDFTPSGLYDTARTPHSQPHSQPYSPADLESVRKQVKREFFKWVSEQTRRASGFYAAELADASEKLGILTMQFAHFDIHRQEHREEKKRMNAQHQKTSSFFSNLDMPSLPESLQRHQLFDTLRHPRKRVISRRTAHTSDFNNKDDHVGYYQAKSMLRNSMITFYHSLVQLREFRQLNQTAVRKIVKKFDKQLHFDTLAKYTEETHDLSLRSGQRLEEIVLSVEQLFSKEFTKGNHKLALELLGARFYQSALPHNGPVMFSAFFIGAALPLIILAIWAALGHLHTFPQESDYLLQMYGGFTLLAVMFVGVGFCMLTWHQYRINYPFIMDLDTTTTLDYREYWVLPGLFVLGLALFGWLTFNTSQSFHRYYPCLFLGLAVAVLIVPTKRFLQGNTRQWLMHSLWRLLLSGFYPVEFRDLMLGDLMCSLTYTMSNMELFFCVYATPHWWSGAGSQHAQRCTSTHSRAYGFLACLPGIWRFLQCWRRYADTLDWFPHLLNAGKYTFNVLYNMSLSIARIDNGNMGLRAMFIVFALINGIYSGAWDVLMDFSLVPSAKPRDVLVYPRWTYWCAMASDFIMRQNWVLYVIFWGNHRILIGFIVGLIETTRRVIWLAYRVENEHAANIARCRAFKELSLPYDDVRPEITSPEEAQTEPEPHQPSHSSTWAGLSRRNSRLGSISGSPRTAVSPRVAFAHTNDFQRKKPTLKDDEDEDDDD